MPYLLCATMCRRVVPFQCDHCFNIGYKPLKEANRRRSSQTFCNSNCAIKKRRSEIRYYDRICLECNKNFATIGNDPKKLCSNSCSATYTNKRRSKEVIERYASKLRGRPQIKRVAAYKKKYENNPNFCSECNKILSWELRERSTCSNTCLKKAYSNPETAQKIAASRKKRFEDGSLKVTGGNTRWLDYKNLRVQGTYELRACHILDDWKDNNLIENWEYTNDRIPYTNIDGKKSMYLLDFKIWDHDGTVYYIETKGYKRANDQLKWDAAKEAGLDLRIWFNEEIVNQERLIQSRNELLLCPN